MDAQSQELFQLAADMTKTSVVAYHTGVDAGQAQLWIRIIRLLSQSREERWAKWQLEEKLLEMARESQGQ